MKKKLLIVIVVLLLCVTAVGGYTALNSISPKAKPVNIPSADTIISVSLSRNNDVTEPIEISELEDLLKNIAAAKPTRKMSVTDYPTAKIYYILELHTTERFYRCFIYEENSQVYVEIPYAGIYKANFQILDLVSSYFH